MTVVQVITAQCSKDPTLMHLLRCVLFFCADGDFKLRVKRISGRSNTFVASICRSFFRRFPGHRHPMPISDPLGICLRGSGLNGSLPFRGSGKRLHLKQPGAKLLSDLPVRPIRVTSHTLAASRRASDNPLVAHLSLRLPHSSVRSYLSAVRHMHIVHGFSDPLFGTPQLKASSQGPEKLGLNSEQVTHIYQLHNMF